MTGKLGNLRPVTTREEAIKRGRAGGKASGVSKRKKRTMREMLELLLEARSPDAEGKDTSSLEQMSLALIRKAVSGDTRAFEIIRDTIGQKPTDKIQAEGFNEPRKFVFEIVKGKNASE